MRHIYAGLHKARDVLWIVSPNLCSPIIDMLHVDTAHELP